jgi:hypothetical protein
MTTNSVQLEMLPRRALKLDDETQEQIARRCTDRHDALIKSFIHSELEPKQVYGPLKISQTKFSLFLNRKASLSHAVEHDYMRLCGNEIALRYDAWKFGQELKPVRSDLERKILELEEALEIERALSARVFEMRLKRI